MRAYSECKCECGQRTANGYTRTFSLNEIVRRLSNNYRLSELKKQISRRSDHTLLAPAVDFLRAVTETRQDLIGVLPMFGRRRS